MVQGSIVERLVEHRGVVEPLVLELVERVGHRAFTTSLQHLGLLAPSQHPSSGDSISPEDHKSQGLKQEFWRGDFYLYFLFVFMSLACVCVWLSECFLLWDFFESIYIASDPEMKCHFLSSKYKQCFK